MSITRLLSNAGLFVIEDSRAKHRKGVAPDEIVFQYFDNDDIFGAVTQAVSTTVTPMVLILKTGQVMVLNQASQGGIALQGTEDNLTPEQEVALPIVQQTISKHFVIKPKGMPKKKPKPVLDAPDAPLSDETALDDISTPQGPEVVLESEPQPDAE